MHLIYSTEVESYTYYGYISMTFPQIVADLLSLRCIDHLDAAPITPITPILTWYWFTLLSVLLIWTISTRFSPTTVCGFLKARYTPKYYGVRNIEISLAH